MLSKKTIPDAFTDDEATGGRLKVKLAEALTSSVLFHRRMDESDWKKFATLHGLSDRIIDHPRFLRSLQWDDPDHEGHVLDLVTYLFDYDPPAFIELFGRPNAQAWLEKNEPDLLRLWSDDADPIVTALAHGLSEVEATNDIIDLSTYAKRIEAALPHDPHQALGATKDLLETTMRSILSDRGETNFEKLDFPALTSRCFAALGMAPGSPPTTQSDRYLRKMASSARSMIDAANELRNLAGTGHGRVVGEEVYVSPDDAGLVASNGLILAAWLLRRNKSAS